MRILRILLVLLAVSTGIVLISTLPSEDSYAASSSSSTKQYVQSDAARANYTQFERMERTTPHLK